MIFLLLPSERQTRSQPVLSVSCVKFKFTTCQSGRKKATAFGQQERQHKFFCAGEHFGFEEQNVGKKTYKICYTAVSAPQDYVFNHLKFIHEVAYEQGVYYFALFIYLNVY